MANDRNPIDEQYASPPEGRDLNEHPLRAADDEIRGIAEESDDEFDDDEDLDDDDDLEEDEEEGEGSL